MRLLSISLGDPRFADGAVDIQFASLSALWGPNDAGKTTLLRRVHDVLAWLTGRGPSLERDALQVFDIVVELSSAEAEHFAAAAVRDLDDTSPQNVQVGNVSVPLSMAVPSAERDAAARALDEGRGALDAWIELGLSYAGADDELRRTITDAIRDRPVLRLLSSSAPELVWSAFWAVDAAVAGRFEHVPDATRWPAVVQAHPKPVTCAALPTPIAAGPDFWQPLAGSFADRIDSLTRRLATDDSSEVAVVQACIAVMSEAVARRTPDFVPERYRLQVAYSPDHEGLGLAVTNGEGRTFSPDRLAEGYQLWMQLALADVVEQFATFESALQHAYDDDPAFGPARTIARTLTSPIPEPSDIEAAVQALTAIERTWAHTRRDDAPTWSYDPLLAALARTPRLYIIDEPERHLHPALQRQAADWMRVMAAEPAVQFLYASHAPAMLGVPGDVSLIHVSREAGRGIELDVCDPRELRASDSRISGLGLDRGELLAFYRAVLLVEGETDKAVLETLYPDRLRDIGLLVHPFHGTKNAGKLVAELLFRMMSPPFHALIDNCSEAELASVEVLDASGLDQAIKDRRFTGELAFVASLRRTALAQGRDVRIHAIPEKDILGALDDDCIAEVLREHNGGRRWPGFAALMALDGNYNEHLRKFGLSKDPEQFAGIAAEMRRRGLTSPSLDTVLESIWRTTNQL